MTALWLFDLVLCLHVLSAFAMVSGIVLAGVGFELARRRCTCAEIVALLGLARVGAVFVMAGTLGAAGFGLWQVSLGHWGYGTAWVDVAIALLVVVTALGAFAAQPAKRARQRARTLADDGRDPDAKLQSLLNSPIAFVLNYVSAVIMVGIIVDMLVKPGS